MKNLIRRTAAIALACGIAGVPAFAQTSGKSKTLDTVKSRGTLSCGVNPGLAGFSIPDDKGNWTGIDADFCRAVAVAIFNDPKKIKFIPLSAKDRFTALQTGEIDVLARNGTWTMSREADLGLMWAGVNYYDGQAFMVRKKLVTSALELSQATICVQQGTTTELNLADFFRANNMKYEVVAFATNAEAVKAYDSGRCDAYTTDASGLYAERTKLANPADHIILPEIISKEPLGPAVRQGDDIWLNIVKWSLFAMINAEELGVTKSNVDAMLKSKKPEIKRLLGVEGDFGKNLGLTKDWAYRIVKHVGNYGESFERNVGSASRLKIDRGLNALWSNPDPKKRGLMYAPPIR
ncbi:MAG: amino acid ABC transporter substrate-binding protein [Beijerinckiaceae bacterium]